MRLLKSGVLFFVLFSLLSSSCVPLKSDIPEVQLRGVWVQGKSVLTKDAIDTVIQRAQAGGFKQIFVGVFGSGTTLYPSQFTQQNDDVEAGFDPLAYLVEAAHSHSIEVHAWFAVGRVANNRGRSVVIEEHPDWGLVGPDGKTMPWLNFTRPEARKFISDVMMEAVARGVDGIHFDYTRYPSEEWGFDDYSIQLFNEQHDFDLNELRYGDLPAYGQFEGNALLFPSTAEVLAEFSNGFPAVMLNEYGDGQVLILNWQAGQRKTSIGGEILKRGIESFLQDGKDVYILKSETTIAEYGEQTLTSVASWLEDLGWDAVEVTLPEVHTLNAGSVLVLPYVYLISEPEAAQLEQFVKAGGQAIFIDSPTPSMSLSDLRKLTGMQPIRKYFNSWLLMTARGEHPLVPVSERSDDINLYKERNKQWIEFRESGIDTLIKDFYTRVKAEHSNLVVSVTITSDQAQAAQENMQDWQTWLDQSYIDVLIPRAYEDAPGDVQEVLGSWSDNVKAFGRMTFGVIAYTEDGDEEIPKVPSQLLKEIELVLNADSNGFMVFDLDRMSEEQLKAVANIPLKTK